VKRKASGKKIEVAEPEEKESNVVDLMDALRSSLKHGGKGGDARTKAKPRRKSARRHKRAA
jgi:non-homologous end joining protein Ku